LDVSLRSLFEAPSAAALAARLMRDTGLEANVTSDVPLVPRPRIHGVDERMDHAGRIVVPLDLDRAKPILERLKNEGAASPADVLLIVDAARLWQAEQLGLFQPVKSAVLEERIPAKYRDPAGDWYGFSYRARVIVYNKAMVERSDVATYAALADPKNKGKVCTRSGSHPYNLSLIGSEIANLGPAKAEAWARGVVANMARAPKGGDTDQIKAVAAGESV